MSATQSNNETRLRNVETGVYVTMVGRWEVDSQRIAETRLIDNRRFPRYFATEQLVRAGLQRRSVEQSLSKYNHALELTVENLTRMMEPPWGSPEAIDAQRAITVLSSGRLSPPWNAKVSSLVGLWARLRDLATGVSRADASIAPEEAARIVHYVINHDPSCYRDV